jgi:hypothetical protein
MTYPTLTPAFGLGSTARTGPALLISSPRNKIGSQGRIYSAQKRLGNGPAYFSFIANLLAGQSGSNRFNQVQ